MKVQPRLQLMVYQYNMKNISYSKQMQQKSHWCFTHNQVYLLSSNLVLDIRL